MLLSNWKIFFKFLGLLRILELYNITKNETEKFRFGVIIFEPIKTQTCLAPRNVWIPFFVKNNYVVAEKMTRSGFETAIYHSQILGSTL